MSYLHTLDGPEVDRLIEKYNTDPDDTTSNTETK